MSKKYISKGAPTKRGGGGEPCQKEWRSQIGDAEPTHKHEKWKQIWNT